MLKIKEYRQLRGMTQQELAIRACITQGYLSALEKDNKSPTFRILEKIAKALEVCPCMLINHTCKCKKTRY